MDETPRQAIVKIRNVVIREGECTTEEWSYICVCLEGVRIIIYLLKELGDKWTRGRRAKDFSNGVKGSSGKVHN